MGIWGPPETTPRVRMSAEYWQKPYAWNRIAKTLGTRLRVFSLSMGDVGEDHPQVGPWRRELFDMIRATPWLEWLLLTKRPDVLLREWPWTWSAPPRNVVVGVTAETQRYADLRIPALLQIPALWHFVSVEPMLGPIVPDPAWIRPRRFLVCADERQSEADDNCRGCTGDPRDYVMDGADVCSAEWSPSVDWWILGGESGSAYVPGESDVDWIDDTDPGESVEKRPRRVLDLDAAERLARTVKAAGKSVYIKQDSAPKPGQRGRMSDWLWGLKEWPTDAPDAVASEGA